MLKRFTAVRMGGASRLGHH